MSTGRETMGIERVGLESGKLTGNAACNKYRTVTPLPVLYQPLDTDGTCEESRAWLGLF